MSNNIKKLDKDIINLISAGEVIESPAAICKELIENSIDSGAKNIVLEIKNGGKSYIRVTDDGSGIDETQIANAFQSHYTSKITTYEDFISVTSNGFRGEALASISAISKVTIITRTLDKNYAIKAKLDKGEVTDYEKTGANLGTTLIAEDIFYNTPARRNFLKNDKHEARKITDYMIKYAISNTDISFQYINNDKNVFQTYGSGKIEEVISLLFNREFDNSIILVNENIYQDVKLSGAIGNNTTMLSNRRGQYIFVNNRIVENKELIQYIEHSYRKFIPSGNFPIFFLNIKINPQKIDINIHPNKLHVKFFESLNIFEKISLKIEEILLNYQMIPEVKVGNKNENQLEDEIIKQLEIKLNNNFHTYNSNDSLKKIISEDDEEYVTESQNFTEQDFYLKDLNKKNRTNKLDTIELEIPLSSQKYEVQNKAYIDLTELNFRGRIFNTYIALENDDTVFLIDQHAAHERILFEKFSKLFTEQKINTQRLLVPENIKISYEIMEEIDLLLELLEKTGFEVEIFGDNIILVRGVPTIFSEDESKKFIENAIDIIYKENLRNDVIYDKIATKACKAAIKGNMINLKNNEIKRLIEDLEKCENRYACPHGRPVIIEISKYEIEKLFKRIL